MPESTLTTTSTWSGSFTESSYYTADGSVVIVVDVPVPTTTRLTPQLQERLLMLRPTFQLRASPPLLRSHLSMD